MELTAIINKINSFLWGVPLLILLLGGGIYLSIKLGFPQIHILKIMKKTVFTLFKKESSESDSLSQFQTFSTALAATVGTGSVVGVGECIRIGGAGSVFWMWVSAFFGMGLAYCENYLGVRCSDGKLCGAASYLEKIGRTKLTAVLFAVFTVGASLGMGNMVQTGSAAAAAREGFGIPSYIFALVVLIFVFLVAVGKNSAACLCEKLVPIMAVLFIGGSLGVIIFHPLKAAGAIAMIVKNAFCPTACITGSVAGTIIFSMVEGLKRGAFSNEAGLGSTVAVHSSCRIKSPELQGTWAMAEVFIDTFVICTLTAVVIIISGTDLTGEDMAVRAYNAALGGAGKYFMSGSLILFALATVAGWFFIGERAWRYLFPRSDMIYRIMAIACGCIGTMWSMELVWGVSDIFNGLMAVPNVIGVLVLWRKEVEMRNEK